MTNAVQGAAVARPSIGVASGPVRRILVALFALAIVVSLVAITAPAPVRAEETLPQPSPAEQIVAFAKEKLGSRFRMGATGPTEYDCSGLVYRTYEEAGLLDKIGGARKRAAGYYRWFKERGLTSRENPEVGDLVWWTHKGKIVHTGLWIGDDQALSALINPYGVRVHKLTGVGAQFLAFGHVKLESNPV
jgi:cell wall-associated NlpC family hydrolase